MCCLRKFMDGGWRLLAALCVVLVFAGAVSAYTLVMRDGRRREIPAQFVLTRTTLTYEVSPGFQVTVPLASVDVSATERANGEQPGAFLKRAASQPAQQKAQPITPTNGTRAQRSITNRDLETYARARKQSEVAYEQRRRELGLPSVEESRLRSQAEAELIMQELGERRFEESEKENYWRSRASELRTEVSAVDAEINFVRTRLDEVASQLNSNSFSVVTDVYPLGFGFPGFDYSNQSRFRGYRNSSRFGRQNTYAPRGSSAVTRSYDFRGGRRRNSGRINPGFRIGNGFPGPLLGGLGYGRYGGGYGITDPYLPLQDLTGFNSAFSSDDLRYERTELITRLNELVGQRAGLLARWRELEEEARRAGTPPGWLRR